VVVRILSDLSPFSACHEIEMRIEIDRTSQAGFDVIEALKRCGAENFMPGLRAAYAAMTKRPIQFEDPEIDILLKIVLSLGREVYALRDRARIVEKTLEARGSITRAEIEAYQPTPEEEEELRKEREAFFARFLGVFEGNLE
jgi:hypothetical protein